MKVKFSKEEQSFFVYLEENPAPFATMDLAGNIYAKNNDYLDLIFLSKDIDESPQEFIRRLNFECSPSEKSVFFEKFEVGAILDGSRCR